MDNPISWAVLVVLMFVVALRMVHNFLERERAKESQKFEYNWDLEFLD